jgi:hypothetical protein
VWTRAVSQFASAAGSIWWPNATVSGAAGLTPEVRLLAPLREDLLATP